MKTTHIYARLSLVSTLAISVLTTIHHYYRFGIGAGILGLIVIGLPTLFIFWFRTYQKPLPLIAYGLASGWVIIGFGLIDGMWDSTLKLFLGNFLLVRQGYFFSWNPVGSFLFEVTGVLASIAALFAVYYLYRFLVSALKDLRNSGTLRNVVWVPSVIVSILIVATTLFLSQRSLGVGPSVPKNGVVKIGVIVPATGPTALLGNSFLKAVRVAQEDLKGARYTYELVVENSSISDPLQTKTAIQKLIKVDGVNAIIGGISASGEIVKPYVSAARIPHICVCSITSIGDGQYNFTNISIPKTDAAGWVAEAEKRNVKTIAVLTVAYPSIDGHVRALKEAAQAKGMKVVYEKRFDMGTTDFARMIAEAKAAQPDVYFVESFNPSLDMLGKQLRDAGVKNITGFVTPSLSAKPELFEGAWYVDTNLSDLGFRERFEAKYPDTQFATHMMPFAYDAFNLLVQGFESKEGVVEYIRGIRDYESAAGKVIKKPGSGTFEPTSAIWEIKNGRPELVHTN